MRGGQCQHLGERRRPGSIAAIVVRDEDAVAPAAHVDLEHVRPALDRGGERLEGVLWPARGVAAMSDAERSGDGRARR